MPTPMPTENTFDHLRDLDGEHVGYIHMTPDGFIPFDLLHHQRAAAVELDAAENLSRETSVVSAAAADFVETRWVTKGAM